jgi:hypothetical protein
MTRAAIFSRKWALRPRRALLCTLASTMSSLPIGERESLVRFRCARLLRNYGGRLITQSTIQINPRAWRAGNKSKSWRGSHLVVHASLIPSLVHMMITSIVKVQPDSLEVPQENDRGSADAHNSSHNIGRPDWTCRRLTCAQRDYSASVSSPGASSVRPPV